MEKRRRDSERGGELPMVKTVEEAVKMCEERFLNVQFEASLESGGSRSVVVSSSPFSVFRGSDLVDAVNKLLTGEVSK